MHAPLISIGVKNALLLCHSHAKKSSHSHSFIFFIQEAIYPSIFPYLLFKDVRLLFPLSLLQHIHTVLSTYTDTNYVLKGISTMTCYFGYFIAGFLLPVIKPTNLANVQSRFRA